MSGGITIKVDAREALRFMDTLSKQAPFAISRALNQTANDGQKSIRARIANEFTLRRRQFILRTVKREKGKYPRGDFAHKTILAARVRIDGSRDVLAKFEKDKTKRPVSSHRLAIPIEAKRTAKGIVSKRERIKSLGLHREGGRIVGPKGVRKSGDFIFKWTKRLGTRLLFKLQRAVPIASHRLHFVDTFTRKVRRKWPSNMRKAFEHAIRTAKR